MRTDFTQELRYNQSVKVTRCNRVVKSRINTTSYSYWIQISAITLVKHFIFLLMIKNRNLLPISNKKLLWQKEYIILC